MKNYWAQSDKGTKAEALVQIKGYSSVFQEISDKRLKTEKHKKYLNAK